MNPNHIYPGKLEMEDALSQRMLVWQNLILGKISKAWKNIQQHYYNKIESTQSAEMWKRSYKENLGNHEQNVGSSELQTSPLYHERKTEKGRRIQQGHMLQIFDGSHKLIQA